MKKLLFLLIMILFIGCEKERCFTCTATLTDRFNPSNNYSQTMVICGTMTRAEVKDAANTATVTGSGIKVSVSCNKQ